MKYNEKTVSLIHAIVMVLGLLPVSAFASGTNNVYISVSFDGQYIDDKNGDSIAYMPISAVCSLTAVSWQKVLPGSSSPATASIPPPPTVWHGT